MKRLTICFTVGGVVCAGRYSPDPAKAGSAQTGQSSTTSTGAKVSPSSSFMEVWMTTACGNRRSPRVFRALSRRSVQPSLQLPEPPSGESEVTTQRY